jgi:hypothetical protein
MSNKKDEKSCKQIIIQFLIGIIIALIALMLIVVVRDRCAFHKKVYDIAITEINVKKKAYADSSALDSLNKRRTFADTISKSVHVNEPSSDSRNHNEISQTVSINNSNPIKQITGDVSSIIDTLKDTDGLISANGITYLISLIVALLIALVSDRVIAMEKRIADMRDLEANLRDLEANLRGKETNLRDLEAEHIENMKKMEEEINEMQKKLQQVMSFYSHTTNYNNLLNKIASLYNHIILIDITLSSAEITEKTLEVILLLNSRINIICDNIKDRVSNKKNSLGFITSDEKSNLFTYVEDALSCLKMNLNNLKVNEVLYNTIQDKMYLVEEIRDKIGAIEVQENIYTA